MGRKRQTGMAVLPWGVCGPWVSLLVFSWEPQPYKYNPKRTVRIYGVPDAVSLPNEFVVWGGRKSGSKLPHSKWRRDVDRRDGSGHCGGGAHPGGDRAAWRSVFETDLYAEGTRILRAVQEQVRTVCGAVCGKRGGDEGARNGLETRREMGGFGGGAGDERAADAGDRRRSGKDCSAARSQECRAQHHAYRGSSACAGDF